MAKRLSLQEMKSGGLMKQKEQDLFSLRLHTVGGHVTTDQLLRLAEVAQKYGRDHIHLTTRQGVEVPYVTFDQIDDVVSELSEVGLDLGACGTRVRTIIACQGALCLQGVIDPLTIARKLDARYFGQSGFPHKFKIAITGCVNSCAKPQENDLGIMGIVEKSFEEELCNLCEVCVHVCPSPGTLNIEDDHLIYDPERCIHCGKCISVCPKDAWKAERYGYVLFVGGKVGKFPRFADRLPEPVFGEERLLEVVDRILTFYREYGQKRERFGDTIDRVGLETLRAYAFDEVEKEAV